MSNLWRTIAAGAFAWALMAAPSYAEAQTTVEVDNYLNPSAWSDAASNDSTQICLRYEGSQGYSPGWYCETDTFSTVWTHQVIFNYNFVASQISGIRFTHSGGDMMIIDEWDLYDSFGARVGGAGVDNEGGYCLSTQTETQTSHCTNGQAYPIHHWYW